MLEPKTTCKSCERPVLVRTTEATGGYCMRCFKLPPDEREDSRRARGPATLSSIEHALRQTLRVHVPTVVRLLGSESIYGFALFTDPFYELITSCVFTEAGLRRVAERYQREAPTVYGADCSLDQIERGLRWSTADSPYIAFRETEDFHDLHLRLGDLWRTIPRDDEAAIDRITTAIEGICIAALRELRSSHLMPSSAPLLLLQSDQGWEERFALAEFFNPPEILDRLRCDWQPDEKLLEHYKSRFARYAEITNVA